MYRSDNYVWHLQTYLHHLNPVVVVLVVVFHVVLDGRLQTLVRLLSTKTREILRIVYSSYP